MVMSLQLDTVHMQIRLNGNPICLTHLRMGRASKWSFVSLCGPIMHAISELRKSGLD
jgi:hypothetical protein